MQKTHRVWAVDAIEEGVAAVYDEGRIVRVPAWILPEGVREGDLLAVTREEREGEAMLAIRLDHEATERELRRSREQVEGQGRGADPGGHITL